MCVCAGASCFVRSQLQSGSVGFLGRPTPIVPHGRVKFDCLCCCRPLEQERMGPISLYQKPKALLGSPIPSLRSADLFITQVINPYLNYERGVPFVVAVGGSWRFPGPVTSETTGLVAMIMTYLTWGSTPRSW